MSGQILERDGKRTHCHHHPTLNSQIVEIVQVLTFVSRWASSNNCSTESFKCSLISLALDQTQAHIPLIDLIVTMCFETITFVQAVDIHHVPLSMHACCVYNFVFVQISTQFDRLLHTVIIFLAASLKYRRGLIELLYPRSVVCRLVYSTLINSDGMRDILAVKYHVVSWAQNLSCFMFFFAGFFSVEILKRGHHTHSDVRVEHH